MKKILLFLLLIPTLASAQWLNVGNTLQRTADTKQYRFSLGSPGFAPIYTKSQVDSLANTLLTGVGNSSYIPVYVGSGFSRTLANSSIYQSALVPSIGINTTTFNGVNPEALLVQSPVSSTSINGIISQGNVNNYYQLKVKNTNAGTSASSDIIAEANDGSETTNYVDLGINSSAYTAGAVGIANDSYVLNQGGALYLGTTGANALNLFTNNNWASPAFSISSAGVVLVNGSPIASGSTNPYLGYIYNKGTGTLSLSDFTNNNVTVSLTGGNLVFNNASLAWNQTLDITAGQTASEYWTQTMKYTVGSIGATTYGVGLGINSTNTGGYGLYSVQANLNVASGANQGQLSIYVGITPSLVTGATSNTNLTLNAGDQVQVIFTRDYNVFTFTAYDITTQSAPVSVSYTYQNAYSAPYNMPNTGRFCITSYGGSETVTSYSVLNRAIKNSTVAIVGDSKSVGLNNTFGYLRFSDIVAQKFNTITLAGGNDKSSDVLNRISEIIALTPKSVVLEIGSNDIRNGISEATLETNYASIVTQLTSAGISVYELLPLYENSGVSQSALKAFIIANYPSTYIDTKLETYAGTASNVLAPDNIHINGVGNQIVGNAIVNSGFLTNAIIGNNSDVAIKNGLLDLGAGYNGTNYSMRMGSLYYQPVAADNSFYGNNTYYTGSGTFTRILGGYNAEWINMNGGQFIFSANPTGTAGTYTPVSQFKIDQTNNTVAGGGSGNTSAGNTTGYTFVANNTGFYIPSLNTTGVVVNLSTGQLITATALTGITVNGLNLRACGQNTLVAGTKAISVTGTTTSSQAFVTVVSQGGTYTTTVAYKAVCTAGTVTVTAVTNSGATDATDTSIVNVLVIN